MKDTDASGCGKCNLCCKTMGVAEIGKERGTWCVKAVKSGGCACYAERPVSCREYECLWLISQRTTEKLPIELKPSNCGAVINPTTKGDRLVVELNEGADWRGDTPLGRLIAKVSEQGLVIVSLKWRRWLVRNNMVVHEYYGKPGEAISTVEVEDVYV